MVVKEHHPAGGDDVCYPIIPAFKKLRQEDCPSSNKPRCHSKSQESLGYMAIPCLNIKRALSKGPYGSLTMY